MEPAPSPSVPSTTSAASAPEAEAAPARDPRARLVLWISAVAAVAVMGVLVGLAVVDTPAGLAGSQAGGVPPSPPPYVDPVPMPTGCVPDPERPPKLELDLTVLGIDFGQVKQGQVVDRRVTFRNTGQGALCIRDVQTGCGCVKARLEGDKRRYEAGESGAFLITLDSTGRSGPQNKAFSVVTNELDQPRRTWPVKVDISLGVIVSSHALDFGRPRRGQPATGTVRLTSPKTDPAWTVTDLTAGAMGSEPAPTYTWEVHEVADPNLRVLDLKVTHPGRPTDGLWRAPVTVKLNHPDRAEVTLEGVLLISPPVQAMPPMAIFGFVDAGLVARPIKIHLRHGTTPAVPFEVTDVQIVAPAGKSFDAGGAPFVITQGKEERSGAPFIEVRYDGKARQPGLLEAELLVSTTVAEQKEIRIPLKATVSGPR